MPFPRAVSAQPFYDDRKGAPVLARYNWRQAAAEREAEVAALVAAAQARADTMPGAIPRCTRCRKPQAECPCDMPVPAPAPSAEPGRLHTIEPGPEPVPAGPARCDRCGYLLARCDCAARYR